MTNILTDESTRIWNKGQKNYSIIQLIFAILCTSICTYILNQNNKKGNFYLKNCLLTAIRKSFPKWFMYRNLLESEKSEISSGSGMERVSMVLWPLCDCLQCSHWQENLNQLLWNLIKVNITKQVKKLALDNGSQLLCLNTSH